MQTGLPKHLTDNTGQKNLNVFGTRGKISNPNITLNAEFSKTHGFFCDSLVKCERNPYIFILHTTFTLPKM
jgi:hypothetical protein